MEVKTQITLSKASLAKVVDGRKTIISCWLDDSAGTPKKAKRSEIVHLHTGGPHAAAKAVVSDVLEFDDLTPSRVRDILDFYGADAGISEANLPVHKSKLARKKRCTLIFLERIETIAPRRATDRVSRPRAIATWVSQLPLSFAKSR